MQNSQKDTVLPFEAFRRGLNNKQLIFFLLIFALFYSASGYSQIHMSRNVPNLPRYDEKKLHFGFFVGGNQMMLKVNPKTDFQKTMYYPDQMEDLFADSAQVYSVYGKGAAGIALGIVSSYRIGKYFTVRFVPGLQFGERSVEYDIMQYDGLDSLLLHTSKRVPSTYVDFPIHIKYHAKRIHNFRPYIYGGATAKIDLASAANKNEETKDVLLKLERMDFALELGAGFDVFTNWFKFSTQFKMSYGIVDVLHAENTIYADGIGSINSKMFQIVFTFE